MNKDLQDALMSKAKTSLKKTKTNDKSRALDSGFLQTSSSSPEADKKHRDEVVMANAESWVPLLGDYTFDTKFVPISQEDAKVFVDAYTSFENYSKSCVINGKDDTKDFKLPTAIADRAHAMLTTLQSAIDSMRDSPTDPVFVKASSRSPKDAPAAQAHLSQVYTQYRNASSNNSDNRKLECMLMAGLELLKVHSAQHALDLFFRSDRIAQDMILALQHASKDAALWNEHFVVRKWVPIDVSNEFRGFVYKVYFPHLVTHENQLATRLQHFYSNEIKPLLASKFSSYIIDFAIIHGDSDPRSESVCSLPIKVIELNPFLDSTDAGLFSWKTERNILENQPFEFRVLQKPIPNACKLVSHDWRTLLEN